MRDGETSKRGARENDNGKESKEGEKKTVDPDWHLRWLRRRHLFSDNPPVSNNRLMNKPEWMRTAMGLDKTPRGQRVGEVRQQIENCYNKLDEKLGNDLLLNKTIAIKFQRAKTLSNRALRPRGYDLASSKGREHILKGLRTIAEELQRISDDIDASNGKKAVGLAQSGSSDSKSLSQPEDIQSTHSGDWSVKVDKLDEQMDEHIVDIAQKLIQLVRSSDFDMDRFQKSVGSRPDEFLKRVQDYRAASESHRFYMEAMNLDGSLNEDRRNNVFERLQEREQWLQKQKKLLDYYEGHSQNLAKIDALKVEIENLKGTVKIHKEIPLQIFRSYIEKPSEHEDEYQTRHYAEGPKIENQKNYLDQQIKRIKLYQNHEQSITEFAQSWEDIRKLGIYEEKNLQLYMNLKENNSLESTVYKRLFDSLGNEKKFQSEIRRMKELQEHTKKGQHFAELFAKDISQRVGELLAPLNNNQELLQNEKKMFSEFVKDYKGRESFTLDTLKTLRPMLMTPGSEDVRETCRDWHVKEVKFLKDYQIYRESPDILKKQLEKIQNSPGYDEEKFKKFRAACLSDINNSDETERTKCFDELQDCVLLYNAQDQIQEMIKSVKELKDNEKVGKEQFKEIMGIYIEEFFESLITYNRQSKNYINDIIHKNEAINVTLERTPETLDNILEKVKELEDLKESLINLKEKLKQLKDSIE